MKPEDEEQIRQIVGRDLDTSELAIFDTLDELSTAVENMGATIAKRGRILAFLYLRDRVPSAEYGEVLLRLEQITSRERS